MKWTALLITTVVIILGIYDLLVVVPPSIRAWVKGKPEPNIRWSISRFMQWLPRRATFFVCVVFYCMGHFWGFMDCPDCPKPDEQCQEELLPIPETEPIPANTSE